MAKRALPPRTEAAIWACVIHPNGDLTPQTARALLTLEFDHAERARAHELTTKAQDGSLPPAEEYEADNLERVGTLLAILKSRARKVLKRSSRRHARGA